jgi:transposase
MGFAADPLVLSVEVRAELERRVRAHRDVRRARAVLLCADGMSLRQIGIEIGMDQHKVGEWRKRFLADGLDGLNDRARPGRPRRFGHDDRMKLAALATSEKHDDDPVPMWTYHELADVLFNDGIEISPSQIGRILNAMHIDVTKVRGWLNRRDDPGFWDRVRDVCGIYLNCPDNAIVLSVDEKTSVQAKERKRKTQPARARQRKRVEWEYIRHGTASLFAALNVHSGEVLAEPIEGKNDSTNFCDFLDQIDATIDPTVEVHVVLDNGSSHTSKQTKQWFAEHPRWVVHFTPPHASWVNQVELFFSILQRKVIRNGNFISRDDLITKMLTFIATYDEKAKPFKWTYAGDPLVA